MDCFVLLVEDDPDVRESLRLGLVLEGYPVRTAANGREALALLESAAAPPCLILLDIMMPVMDGFEFLRQKQSKPALAAIPTVVLSAHPRELQFVQPLGVALWLRKPLDLDDLMTAVRGWCGGPPVNSGGGESSGHLPPGFGRGPAMRPAV
ncbi:MAG TPA: response regulator [Burkholderiaceae bacterium]|nr:response regulator [Burkholderiaceae bacterium]